MILRSEEHAEFLTNFPRDSSSTMEIGNRSIKSSTSYSSIKFRCISLIIKHHNINTLMRQIAFHLQLRLRATTLDNLLRYPTTCLEINTCNRGSRYIINIRIRWARRMNIREDDLEVVGSECRRKGSVCSYLLCQSIVILPWINIVLRPVSH